MVTPIEMLKNNNYILLYIYYFSVISGSCSIGHCICFNFRFSEFAINNTVWWMSMIKCIYVVLGYVIFCGDHENRY